MRAELLTQRAFPRTLETLEAGLRDQVAPGMVAAFWDQSRPGVYGVWSGGARRKWPAELPELPMETGTIFDLASVTKVFSTATLTALLVERGWLSWQTPLQAILPEYPHREVRLDHLLSHTAGLPAWIPLWEELSRRWGGRRIAEVPIAERQRAVYERLCAVELETQPGARATYSDLTFLLLGFALEQVVGLPLDEAVPRWLWQPLGIETASYRRVDGSSVDQRDESVAATEISEWRGGLLQGLVHDDNCWAMGGYGGHAGAFGSAEDLMKFSAGLLNGFLSRSVTRAMWTRVSEPSGCDRTLGWDAPSVSGSSTGTLFSRSSAGHLGFTGTSLWIDSAAGLAVALLSNRVHPSRENTRIKAFRPLFHDALRRDLGR